MSDKLITTCCGERMTYEWGSKRCKKCGAEIITMPPLPSDADTTGLKE